MRKAIIWLVAFFVLFMTMGSAYAWSFESEQGYGTAQVAIQEWDFDPGLARMDNLGNVSNLIASRETSITMGSTEAIRFTNTTGTASRDHIFNINLDQNYNLYDIATCKIEFDYYHTYKREQNTKGFPKVQLYDGNTARGSAQGGDDTITEIAPYVVTSIDDDWWHLEYYVTSMCPTICDHQDKPQSNYKVNCIRFNDRGVYDYAGSTGFMILDNLRLTNEPGARLGLFNRTSGDKVGKFFWFKVAWSGELHSCTLSTSDSSIAIPDTTSDKSPFYVKLLAVGSVTVTATLEIGSDHQTFSISNAISVT